jgi:hypothetical protein
MIAVAGRLASEGWSVVGSDAPYPTHERTLTPTGKGDPLPRPAVVGGRSP